MPYTFQDIGQCNCAGPAMTQTFAVGICETVSVYNHSGGTLLATGSTIAAGNIVLSWSGSPGSYYVVLNGLATAYTAYGQTLTLSLGGTTTIKPALTVAGSLTVTDSIIGSTTMALASGVWGGTISYAYPGGTAFPGRTVCAAETTTVTYGLDANVGTFDISYLVDVTNSPCPGTTGSGVGTSLPVPTGSSLSCSPLNLAWTQTGAWDGNVMYFLYLGPITVSWAITP